MKNIYKTFIFSALCLICTNGYSQSTKIDSAGKTSTDSLAKALIDSALKIDKKSSFKINLNYISNNVFFGRADTVSTPTIIPEIKYTFKNGVFVSANASYIPNRSTNKLDGENITLGYDHDFTDDLSAGISFAKLFYTANSTQIGSSISSTISANISYDIADIISPNLSADYDLIKNGFSNDIIINLGIAHDFSKKGLFGSKDILVISPTIELNAGTQNFYEAFLTTKKYKTTAKAIVANAKLNKQLAKLNQFNMLDYELSAPIAYKTGKLTLSFTPTYAIAENKVAPAISKGLVAGTGLFYFNAGATITFE